MNRLFLTILFLILPSLQGCLQVEDESDTTIRLATTTSLRDSGPVSYTHLTLPTKVTV